MNESLKFIIYLSVMAGVTYLLRLLPMLLCRKKIENGFITSFLYYIPYTVLSAMTVPAIFYATANIISAVCGAITAVILAYFKRGLLTVAASASAAVFLTELVMSLI